MIYYTIFQCMEELMLSTSKDGECFIIKIPVHALPPKLSMVPVKLIINCIMYMKYDFNIIATCHNGMTKCHSRIREIA